MKRENLWGDSVPTKATQSGSPNAVLCCLCSKKFFSGKQIFGIGELGREVLPAGAPVPISESLCSPSLHPKIYLNIL